ncbi:hypothetical protein [Leucobacter sp. wl10]|uniref:hypothetical protein n=1 Tax=Leucobacter sp. wl10 TaxID=2304677 RepID=UPI000E5B6DF9|nr:hypothetical protein [Leucobacter sp. wl10]RGE22465.1 hypothetical protein D1J51_04420 [Leucobacter sp. wl10]
MDSKSPTDHPLRPGLQRRTLLKATAWAAPVVAVATTAPLASASGEGNDLAIGGFAGDNRIAFNADRTRYMEQAYTTAAQVVTVGGAEPTPPGSVLSLEWDSRNFTGATIQINGGPSIAPASTAPTGANGTAATFMISQAIPVGTPGDPAGGLSLNVNLVGVQEEFAYVENAHPYVVDIAPPSGTDPDPTNNGWRTEARYGGTWDVAVTDSTWGTYPVSHARPVEQGGPYTEDVRVPGSMTITNLGPNNVPADSIGFYAMVPDRIDRNPSVSNLRATLNGAAAAGAVEEFTNGSQGAYSSQVLVPLVPGDVLLLEWDVSVLDSVAWNGEGIGTGSAGVSSAGAGDVDGGNHFAVDPGPVG